MKSKGTLVETMLSKDNMELALDAAIKSRGTKRGLKNVLPHMKEINERIRYWVKNEAYPGIEHRKVILKQETSGKLREITPPYFTRDMPEHYIHHILIRTISPILERGMIHHTYASIKGRGVHSAKKAIEKHIKKDSRRKVKQARYYLKLDIKKFYQNIHLPTLYAMLCEKIRDKKVQALIKWILGDKERGLPIGMYTSQHFANYYLQGLDHYIEEQLHPTLYTRYMDDLLLFGGSKRKLEQMGERVERYLSAILHLSLKHPPQVYALATTHLNYIGFTFSPERVTIRRRIFTRAMRAYTRTLSHHERYGEYYYHHLRALASYLGWFYITASHSIRRNIIPLARGA